MAKQDQIYRRQHHPKRSVSILALLADLTDKMQKELGNLGMNLPAVSEIKSLLTNTALPMGISAFAETLANNVSTRYGRYYTDKHIILASVLDPRFKKEWVIRDEVVCNKLKEIRNLLFEEAEKNTPPAVSQTVADTPLTATPDPNPELSKRARLFASYLSEQQCAPGETKSEVEKYLNNSQRENPDADVLDLWKENSRSFPRLAKVARTVFSIPSGSARPKGCSPLRACYPETTA
ncbi:unnamed protein product [Merluccius merluccius]